MGGEVYIWRSTPHRPQRKAMHEGMQKMMSEGGKDMMKMGHMMRMMRMMDRIWAAIKTGPERANAHNIIELKTLDRQPNPTEREATRSHCHYTHGMKRPSQIRDWSTDEFGYRSSPRFVRVQAGAKHKGNESRRLSINYAAQGRG